MANLQLTKTRLLTDFPVASNVGANDKFVIIRNPGVDDQIRLVSFHTIEANLQLSNAAPTANNDPGLEGTIRYDDGYLYICYANDSWGRIVLEVNW